MTEVHPQNGTRCEIWEKMSSNPHFDSRVARFADACPALPHLSDCHVLRRGTFLRSRSPSSTPGAVRPPEKLE